MPTQPSQTLALSAIAIDLDGTLVDSAPDLHAAVVQMQNRLGLANSTIDEVRCWVGNGIERLVHRALTGDMYKDAESFLFARAMPYFEQAYVCTNGQHSTLFAGVIEGLDHLRAEKIPLIMVTNKAGRYARPLIDKLNIAEFFIGSVAGDDVKVKKPNPEALLQAAHIAGVAIDECAMIGDSISDIRAAKAAGCTSIAVTYGYNHGVSVRDLGADLKPDIIIESLTQLRGITKLSRSTN